MGITEVRTSAVQIYARIGSGGTHQTSAQGDRETSGDTLILSVQSRETAVYSSGGFRAAKDAGESIALEAGEIPESKDYLREYRSTYLEIIRERVTWLLQDLSGGEDSSPIQPESPEFAPAASSPLSPESYYSPEQTAARIIDFALSFYSGGDREDFARMVQEAVMKGFDQAKAAMGEGLPRAADQTVSLVLNAISQFAAGEEM
ncbi:MAG: hypothetical protein ACYC9O_19880 [Candidatus Latescibacterota bacterium]